MYYNLNWFVFVFCLHYFNNPMDDSVYTATHLQKYGDRKRNNLYFVLSPMFEDVPPKWYVFCIKLKKDSTSCHKKMKT